MNRLLLLSALALAACSDVNPREPLSRDFGNSVNANIAAQVVNPAPAPGGSAEMDGQRADSAIARYRAGKVIPPHPPLANGSIYPGTTDQQPLSGPPLP
jgi:type IV pilus biogenesis protein CpaD/CtpE